MHEDRNRFEEARAGRALDALAAAPDPLPQALAAAMRAQARAALSPAPAGRTELRRGRGRSARGAARRTLGPLEAIRRSAPPAALAASALIGLLLGYAAPGQLAGGAGLFGALEDPALELVDFAFVLDERAVR